MVGTTGAVSCVCYSFSYRYGGFVFFHGWAPWAAALLVGFATTVTLVLLMSCHLVLLRVTRLTAGMTVIGFSLTFVLVFIGEWLADLSNWIEIAFVPSILFMLLALAALGRSERYLNYE
jgi:CP family cyanate transporter-like MFS transporter